MTEGRTSEVPGYGYGAPDTARSPLDMEDLDLLKRTVLFTGEDEQYLRMAGDGSRTRSRTCWTCGTDS